MKKIKAVFLTFAVLCIGWAATAHATTVRGEGHYVEKTLSQLAPFHAIEVRGNAQVDVWQQPTQQVSVSGKQNLVALADIRVENNTLIVDFKQPVHIKQTILSTPIKKFRPSRLKVSKIPSTVVSLLERIGAFVTSRPSR